METPNRKELIDINTIDIKNLKTEMFCDLKIDSDKLKDIVGDRLDIIHTPESRKKYKSVKYFEIVFSNPKDEFNEIMDYVESLANDDYFEKYLKMDYIIRADFICVEFTQCRPIWIEFSSILESKN